MKRALLRAAPMIAALALLGATTVGAASPPPKTSSSGAGRTGTSKSAPAAPAAPSPTPRFYATGGGCGSVVSGAQACLGYQIVGNTVTLEATTRPSNLELTADPQISICSTDTSSCPRDLIRAGATELQDAPRGHYHAEVIPYTGATAAAYSNQVTVSELCPCP